MEFKIWPAVFAGTIAGAIMVGMRMLIEMAGVDLKLDVAQMWGTMLNMHGTSGRLLGLAIHLLGSAAIALIYAWIFALIGVTDHPWLWGLLGGVIHWVLAGLFMAIAPALHPEIPEQRSAPGLFVVNFGMPDVLTFLIGHLLYGLVVGILYAYFYRVGRRNDRELGKERS
jgi:hypothetical protein